MCSRLCFSSQADKLVRTFSNLYRDYYISRAHSTFSNAVLKGMQSNRGPYFSQQVCGQNKKCFHLSSFSKVINKEKWVVKKSNDPDIFGTLDDETASKVPEDEGEIVEKEYVSKPVSRSKKLRISQYTALIKEHLANKEISLAVDVIEKRMVKEDRVQPVPYHYSLIIHTCAENGQMKLAFKLYRKMLDRGMKIPQGVYTALFNACANCVDSEEALRRAKNLRTKLIEKGIELNKTHYHVMVKAFGRCGDLSAAFQIVDVMVDKQIDISEETFNFLLHACITDKKGGFRYALLVWHKMMQKKIKPSIFTFNLLLRSARDCGVGEPEEFKCTLKQLLTSGNVPEVDCGIDFEQMVISPNLHLELQNLSSDVPVSASPVDNFPDLLKQRPSLGNFSASLDLTKPHQRMFLLGGYSGFLRHMKNFNVNPTIKTFTVLLDCIPPTNAAEKLLISNIKQHRLRIETVFCNALMKRRCFRFDYESARDVMNLMYEQKIQPDLVTFGVLALSCQTLPDARDLIRDMRMAGYSINEEIVGALLQSGCIKHDFKYVMKILYLLKEENLEFNRKCEENVESLIASCRQIVKDERNGIPLPKSLEERKFRQEFIIFLNKYKAWMNETSDKKVEYRS